MKKKRKNILKMNKTNVNIIRMMKKIGKKNKMMQMKKMVMKKKRIFNHKLKTIMII